MITFMEKQMRIHFFSPDHLGTGYIQLYSRNCMACWECIRICPQKVIGKVDIIIHKHARINSSKECTGCLKCVRTCKNGAIEPIKNLNTISHGTGIKKENI